MPFPICLRLSVSTLRCLTLMVYYSFGSHRIDLECKKNYSLQSNLQAASPFGPSIPAEHGFVFVGGRLVVGKFFKDKRKITKVVYRGTKNQPQQDCVKNTQDVHDSMNIACKIFASLFCDM